MVPFMAYKSSNNSKKLNVFRIVLELLKETCTFLFAIAIGCLNLIEVIFE